jgi:hypothetical protein
MIHINRKMPDNWMKLKQRGTGEYVWHISALYKKLRFPLGSQGSLTACKVVGGSLLTAWTSERSTKAFFKRALYWNGGMHHQEYIRAKWNAKDHPIPVFIQADHSVPGIRTKRKKHRPQKPEKTVQRSPRGPSTQLMKVSNESFSSEASSELRIIRMPSRDRETIRRPKPESLEATITPQRRSPKNTPSSDELGSDVDDPKVEKNGWKWDKKFELWRLHVYTDGELDYTTWSRNPDHSDQ